MSAIPASISKISDEVLVARAQAEQLAGRAASRIDVVTN